MRSILCSGKFILYRFWSFNECPMKIGGRYIIRINSNDTGCFIKTVNYRMNIDTMNPNFANIAVNMNDIAHITIKTSNPVFFDSFKKNNITGSMIFIDEGTNETI